MNTHKTAVTGSPTKTGNDRKMRGGKLKAVMETALADRQMSVSALARDADIQRGDIYRWWRGESRPSRNSLARVAKTLGVDGGLLRQALGEAPRTTESADRLAEAIDALGIRLARLEADQAEGFDTVLQAIASSVGAPAPTETSPDNAPVSPSGTAR